MRHLFLAAFLALAPIAQAQGVPVVGKADYCPMLNGKPDYADWDCIRKAHNLYAREITLANGDLAKSVSKMLAAYAKSPSQELVDKKMENIERVYRERIRKAAVVFMHEALQFPLKDSEEFGENVADQGFVAIVNTQVYIWFFQVGYL